MIIQEEWVHAAVEYLREQSNAAAVAKGNCIRAEYHRRKIRARLILESPHPSQGLREAYADSHADYEEITEKLAKCEELAEWHRNERNKAETICEMWRTQSATLRGLGKVA
jgi:hypothetical protein